ncbi:hypothetical protein G7061_09695 [Erysipelothrix sp. HDW6B]|uniref:O-antigen ligase family protein n=1 Tax=Erysipelothrix sp. HDW6B TaxID=2714929 RepID=UPI00140C7FE2|nr:O-antigen ligase family protein [Erysipelothrix sp. HDW6B]QIK86871.1 hypothetical protein G7061_09695 [Erysipelothrix sp. HDW6B]
MMKVRPYYQNGFLSTFFPIYLFILITAYLSLVVISALMVPKFNTTTAFVLMNGMIFATNSIIITAYFILGKQLPLNRKLLIGVLVALVASIATLISSQLHGFEIATFDYIFVPVKLINLGMLFVIPASIAISKKGLKSFAKLIMLLGVLAALFNMYYNYSEILRINTIKSTYAVNFQSFFLNRNTFGQFMALSLIAHAIYYERKHSIMSVLIICLLILNLVLTFSRGAILMASIFLTLYFKPWKLSRMSKNKYIIGITFLGLICIAMQPNVMNFISSIVIRKESGLTGRGLAWETGFGLISNTNLIFGVGNFTAKNVVYELLAHNEYHSFYIETLVSGGLAELFLYGLLFRFMYSRIKLIRYFDINAFEVYQAAYIAMLSYAFIESVSFFSIGYVDTIFLVMFITIPLMYSNFSTHVERDVKEVQL